MAPALCPFDLLRRPVDWPRGFPRLPEQDQQVIRDLGELMNGGRPPGHP